MSYEFLFTETKDIIIPLHKLDIYLHK